MKTFVLALKQHPNQARGHRRRKTVAKLAVYGLTDKEIASKVGISEDTVAWHLRWLFGHYRVHSRTAMVRRYLADPLV